MAILEEVPGLVVTIDVAGRDLVEYNDDDEDQQPLTRSVYVQAESGAKFGIARKFDPSAFPYQTEHIVSRCYLDGKSIGGRSYSLEMITSGRRFVQYETMTNLGDRDVVQNFSFAELNIVEGHEDMKLWGKLNALGTISVKFFRVRYEDVSLKLSAPQSNGYTHTSAAEQAITLANTQHPSKVRTALLENDEVPEKNLKGSAVSHQAKLSIVREIPRVPAMKNQDSKPKQRTVYLDQTPFATFNFKYRSRNALQALLIVERTPPPIAVKRRPDDELTPLEGKEAVMVQKPMQPAEAAKIKKEKRDLSDVGKDELGDTEVSEFLPKKKAKTAEEST